MPEIGEYCQYTIAKKASYTFGAHRIFCDTCPDFVFFMPI